jgi:hypothetical protein
MATVQERMTKAQSGFDQLDIPAPIVAAALQRPSKAGLPRTPLKPTVRSSSI